MENDNLENLNDRKMPEGMEEVGGYRSLRPLSLSPNLPRNKQKNPYAIKTKNLNASRIKAVFITISKKLHLDSILIGAIITVVGGVIVYVICKHL